VHHSIWNFIAFSAVSLLGLSINTLPQTDGPQVVAEAWVKAFNAHDSVAFGRLYTEDADWVNVVGVRVKSREHIQAAHEEAFTTYFKPATITAASRRCGSCVQMLQSFTSIGN
jgi:ketosteroid isomerase-like protein